MKKLFGWFKEDNNGIIQELTGNNVDSQEQTF